jgi:hypothetical protein
MMIVKYCLYSFLISFHATECDEGPIPAAALFRRGSAAASLLVSGGRIPLRAWMFGSCVHMLCCPV